MPSPIEALQSAGFSNDEIAAWSTERRQILGNAGFADNEIDAYFTGGVKAPTTVPRALEDRITAGEEAGKREGGLLQTLPQFAHLVATPEGRGKLWEAVKSYPSKFLADMVETAQTPGDVAAGRIDLTTDEGLDRALGLGTLVGFGRFSKINKTGKTSGLALGMGDQVARVERSPTGEVFDHPVGALPTSADFVNAAHVISPAERISSGRVERAKPIIEELQRLERETSELSRRKDDVVEASGRESKEAGDAFDALDRNREALAEANRRLREVQVGEVDLPPSATLHIQEKLLKVYEEQGRLPAEVAHDAATDPVVAQRMLSKDAEVMPYVEAYHGSPTDFDAFDISKTGAGIYVSTDPTHAQQYAIGKDAKLYTARVNAAISDFIDGAKPLSEQSGAVQRALKASGLEPDLLNSDATGQWLYSKLAKALTPEDGTYRLGLVAANKLLAEAGVPGIRNGTTSIIFDDKLIDITHKNGEPLTRAERADVMTAMGGEGGGQPPKGPVVATVEPPPPPPPAGSLAEAQAKVLDKISVGEGDRTRPYTFRRLYRETIDDLHPLKAIDENAYELARLTRGQFGKAEQFLERSTFDFNTYKDNGKPLAEILKPVADDLNGLRAYLAAKRAIEVEASGRQSGIDLEAAQQVVKRSGNRAGEYDAIAKELVGYQNRLLAYLRDSGVVSEKSFDAMVEAGKAYVPFYRLIGTEMEGKGAGSSLGPGNPVKRLKGSDRQIIDPLESIIKNTYAYISIAERNAAGIELVEALKREGFEAKTHKPPAPKREAPIVQYRKAAAEIEKSLPAVAEGDVRLWRGNRPGEAGQNPHFTNDLPGIALPFREGYGGPLSYVDIPVADLAKYEDHGVVAKGAEFTLPKDVAAKAKVADHNIKATGPDADLLNYLKEHGVTEPEALADFVKNAAPETGDTISAFRDGVREEVKVNDPELVAAFRGLDRQSVGLLTKVFAVPARALRAGAVLTPDFMAKNLIRDFLTAFVNTSGAVFTPIDTVKGLVSVIRRDADYQNWVKAGGANSTMVALDRAYMQESLSKLSGETGLMDRSWNVITSPFRGLRMLSEMAENATRVGEFKKTLGEQTSKEAMQEAAYGSREVTLDFARMGAKMRSYNMLTAFANAQIQGVDRIVRAFADRPVNTTAKIAAGITLPSVLLWWSNHDDPRYQELPAWQRDLFWIIPTDKWEPISPADAAGKPPHLIRQRGDKTEFNNGSIWRIPKPFELGVIFGSGVERALDQLVGGNPEAFKGFTKSVIEVLTPSVIPTAVLPLAEQYANRSTFTDRTLIPADVEKQLPEYQFTPYTTELSKKLGQVFSAFPGMRNAATEPGNPAGPAARALTTPILIENYVRSWTGGLGMYVMQGLDKSLRSVGALPDPIKPTATLADIPFVRAFAVRYPAASAQSIQDFHDDYTQNKRFFDTWMAKAREGDVEAMGRIQAAGGPMMFVQLDGINQTLSEHSKLVRDVYKHPSIPAEEKRQLIDSLYFNMLQIAKGGRQVIHEAKVGLAGGPQPPQ